MSVHCTISKNVTMDAPDIISILQGQYIDNVSSRRVKVLLSNGDILYGEFIKAMQFRNNAKFNIWNITCEGGPDVMLHGGDILSITTDQ